MQREVPVSACAVRVQKTDLTEDTAKSAATDAKNAAAHTGFTAAGYGGRGDSDSDAPPRRSGSRTRDTEAVATATVTPPPRRSGCLPVRSEGLRVWVHHPKHVHELY